MATPVNGQTKYKQTDKGEFITLWGKDNISGVYPHLTTYAHARVSGQYKFGDECGIGALAVWGEKLYMVNYAAHCPNGSEHKLYIIDKNKKMSVYEGSIGGTPAARMIHAESEQLLIGHYLIDKRGNIRTISIKDMPGRITGIARHLKAPQNMVYYYDMEGMLYEVDVNTLEVKKLFHNPLPGWHGKGAYTAQHTLFLSNNGEMPESQKDWKVSSSGMTGPDKRGILAEFDGETFKVIERKQFTDITTRHGITPTDKNESPVWTMGWDDKSIRLKVRENGEWATFLLPKASYNNDPSHGWFTEWPRIREIGNEKMMMDMHGMFYDFPSDFSSKKNSGIRPISSHLRYIPDFCSWNNQIVLATDETSIQGNPLSGQPQSNLWFGTLDDIHQWGPANGYGAIWLKDEVKKSETSAPYLFSGFDYRMAHILNHTAMPSSFIIQIDEKGDGHWKDYKEIRVKGHQYISHIFPETCKGEWIRLKAINGGTISFVLHYGEKDFDRYDSELFKGLASVDYKDEILSGKMFANKSNLNLSIYSSLLKDGKTIKKDELEFDKFDLNFKSGISDSLAKRCLHTEVHYSKEMQFESKQADKKDMRQLWNVDDASVILYTSNGILRLPKGDKAFDKSMSSRCIREVESERELANIHGTFYELPLIHVGKEPLFHMMRPVASHNKLIDDYTSWNGLLIMSGIERNATKSEHIYKNKEKTAGIWAGAIDDLWKLGKPVGVGGPWKNTSVKCDVLSDPYLMTGYDKKKLTLKADKDTNITVWVKISHYIDDILPYKEFQLKAGEEIEYNFPEGFSAHWVYLSADKDCTATGQFTYM